MDVQSLKQDDFEETLVHEVIQENPVEEQGIRPEWQARAGWHRKEYVHLRGADPKQQNDNNLNADGGSANSDVKRSVRLATTTVSIRRYIRVQVYREFKYRILAVSYSFQREGVARK
jgi:hypothetical protein